MVAAQAVEQATIASPIAGTVAVVASQPATTSVDDGRNRRRGCWWLRGHDDGERHRPSRRRGRPAVTISPDGSDDHRRPGREHRRRREHVAGHHDVSVVIASSATDPVCATDRRAGRHRDESTSAALRCRRRRSVRFPPHGLRFDGWNGHDEDGRGRRSAMRTEITSGLTADRSRNMNEPLPGSGDRQLGIDESEPVRPRRPHRLPGPPPK